MKVVEVRKCSAGVEMESIIQQIIDYCLVCELVCEVRENLLKEEWEVHSADYWLLFVKKNTELQSYDFWL